MVGPKLWCVSAFRSILWWLISGAVNLLFIWDCLLISQSNHRYGGMTQKRSLHYCGSSSSSSTSTTTSSSSSSDFISNRKQWRSYRWIRTQHLQINAHCIFCWWSPAKPKAHLAGNQLLVNPPVIVRIPPTDNEELYFSLTLAFARCWTNGQVVGDSRRYDAQVT